MPGLIKKILNIKTIHILLWILIFLIPILFLIYNDEYNGRKSHFLIFAWTLIVILYFNYSCLIDKYLYKDKETDKQVWKFALFNMLLIAALSAVMFAWERIDYINRQEVADALALQTNSLPVYPPPPNIFLFFIGKVLPMMLTVGMSIAIKVTGRLRKAEKELKELERSRTEAELKNLRNQLNPHFLFNTLNNIYALINISPERAQKAILQLSEMMRNVIYDDRSHYIPLKKELNFIKDYISLMRLRIPDDFKIRVNLPETAGDNIKVAPLLFISLVENAFKHGVSSTRDSYIDIDITVENEKIICRIENSYFPKGKDDKSGSGIGVRNLQSRLELLYPKEYLFTREYDDNRYIATIILPVKREEEPLCR